jgi:hypothetical protein
MKVAGVEGPRQTSERGRGNMAIASGQLIVQVLDANSFIDPDLEVL